MFLVSGKISERSFLRYKKLSFFAKKVFENIDIFYVQNAVYKERFSSLGVPDEKLVVTGNFKYQNLPKELSEEELSDMELSEFVTELDDELELRLDEELDAPVLIVYLILKSVSGLPVSSKTHEEEVQDTTTCPSGYGFARPFAILAFP